MPAHANVGTHAVRVCATHVKPGHASCFAMAVTAANGKLASSAKPMQSAFTPTDIQSAYGLTGLKSNGRTVAIVDAYGYPGLASDLAKFRSTFGLPACTTSGGSSACLRIVGQAGGTPPAGNDGGNGWDVEQALDVDAVSAACPDCRILVVEGNAATFADLEQAENTAAATSGVVAISNSYGGGNSGNNAAYNHKGIAITASTGDNGFNGGQYPASDTHVVAVGGTSVTRSAGYPETAWSGAGSGCGTNPQPRWQQSVGTTCHTHAQADVSAAADPNLGGLDIYCASLSFDGCSGFLQVGGTSESSPIIAAVYALSGNTARYPAKYPYKDRADLNDVTSGSNGGCGVPLCQARRGWDGPTGLGTPNGVAAF